MFEGQPKGLWALALANTGERFGYYTMLAVFVLLKLMKAVASEWLLLVFIPQVRVWKFLLIPKRFRRQEKLHLS